MGTDYYSLLRPPKVDYKIWRYMNKEKFVDLMESKALFFTRCDKFNDYLDGNYPQRTLESWDKAHLHLPKSLRIQILMNRVEREIELRKSTYISCWHVNEFENIKMWNEYVGRRDGVVIQSTYKSLYRSLNSQFSGIGDFLPIGKVVYKNHYNSTSDNWLEIFQFLNKDKQYKWENEVRAIFMEISRHAEKIWRAVVKKHENGVAINTNLNYLVENIYISPYSSEGFLEEANHLVNKSGLEKEVQISRLI